MRQRNKPWADDFIAEHADLIIPDPEAHRGKWKELFGNDNPVHLEIGTGKGQFIAGMAEQHPEINFIGMELAKSVIVTAAEKVLEKNVPNVILLNNNAKDLRDFFGENEISGIYLNFSDPWPKSRHEKRRLTFHTFLEQYEDILLEGGTLVQKTDNRGLFEYSLVSYSQYGMLLEDVSLDLHVNEDPMNVKTEYEEKFSAKGQPIYRCQVSFRP